MIVSKGEKVHVVYRRTLEAEVRRHFIGEIIEAHDAIVRLDGIVFIFDNSLNQFIKKTESRTTIINLAESGYIVNLIGSQVNIEDLKYTMSTSRRLTLTDGKGFSLDINEFGANR